MYLGVSLLGHAADVHASSFLTLCILHFSGSSALCLVYTYYAPALLPFPVSPVSFLPVSSRPLAFFPPPHRTARSLASFSPHFRRLFFSPSLSLSLSVLHAIFLSRTHCLGPCLYVQRLQGYVHPVRPIFLPRFFVPRRHALVLPAT